MPLSKSGALILVCDLCSSGPSAWLTAQAARDAGWVIVTVYGVERCLCHRCATVVVAAVKATDG